ncbi:MAG: 30S ribosomal protein S20 [Candidatus Andersenbacteria bacterium]
MPRKHAGKKALRVTARRTAHNRVLKAQLKDAIRKVRTASAKKDAAAAGTALATVISKLDRAAKTRVLPKGRVNRLKSRLTQLVNKIGK